MGNQSCFIAPPDIDDDILPEEAIRKHHEHKCHHQHRQRSRHCHHTHHSRSGRSGRSRRHSHSNLHHHHHRHQHQHQHKHKHESVECSSSNLDSNTNTKTNANPNANANANTNANANASMEFVSNCSCYDARQPIKILFLDVDGVLNGENVAGGYSGVNLELLLLLKEILEITHCKIVLSSTWRLNIHARNYLLHDMKCNGDINVDDVIIGDTPAFMHKKRTAEIAESIDRFQQKFNILSWCAIDDLPLKSFNEKLMAGHFVHTNYHTGITHDNVIQAVKILNDSRAIAEYNSYI